MKLPLLAAGLLLALISGARADAIKLGTEGAYAPWNFVDADGAPQGFDIDVGNAVCQRARLDCSWVVNDWATLLPSLTAGNYDAVFAALIVTEERKQTADFTDAYFPPKPSRFLVLAASAANLATPSGLRIGAQTGSLQATYADAEFGDDNTITRFSTVDEALSGLKAGTVDAVLADGSYAEETVATAGAEIKVAGPALAIGSGVVAAIRKNDNDLKTKLNAALAAIKADGTLDALIARWFPRLGNGPFFPG